MIIDLHIATDGKFFKDQNSCELYNELLKYLDKKDVSKGKYEGVIEIRYKGLTGSCELCSEDDTIYGKIDEGIFSLITFEASTAKELVKVFKIAVDDYISTCKILNKESSCEGS